MKCFWQIFIEPPFQIFWSKWNNSSWHVNNPFKDQSNHQASNYVFVMLWSYNFINWLISISLEQVTVNNLLWNPNLCFSPIWEFTFFEIWRRRCWSMSKTFLQLDNDIRNWIFGDKKSNKEIKPIKIEMTVSLILVHKRWTDLPCTFQSTTLQTHPLLFDTN